MKGRWRKDKRPGTHISTQGDASGDSSKNGCQPIQQALSGALKDFTFSKTANDSVFKRACFESAHNSLVRSQFAMCDGQTHDDFMKALTGGSICIPSFFEPRENIEIFNNFIKELKDYEEHQESSSSVDSQEAGDPQQATSEANVAIPFNGLCQWSKHLKHENPEGFPTFQKVVQRLSDYFDLDVYATRMNIYPDGSHWKPHHHDSHAYSADKKQAEDFTVGASFGSRRSLEFAHVKSGITFCFPQENGSVFAFNSFVNKTFTHGVPAEPKDAVGPRISIIVWGRRRSLNERNACESELRSV